MVVKSRIFLMRVIAAGVTDFTFNRGMIQAPTAVNVDYLGGQINQFFTTVTIVNLSGKDMIGCAETDPDDAIILTAIGGDGMFFIADGSSIELSGNVVERLRIWCPSNGAPLKLILET